MVALACASSQVVAVEPQSIQTSSGFDITPLLTTGLKYDDNVASTSANEIDSWIMTVVPSVKAVLDDGVSKTELTAAVANGTYFDSSADNFTDTFVGGLLTPSCLNKVNLMPKQILSGAMKTEVLVLLKA